MLTATAFLDLVRDGFDPAKPLVLARAPGRLDLMGGIADYSGALVLQLPLREATWVAAQHSDGTEVRVTSATRDATRSSSVCMPVEELRRLATAGYDAAHARLNQIAADAWVAYVLGPLLVLMRERGLALEHGLVLHIASDVPEGMGVSSSAAIEVATMHALAGIFDIALDGRELALLCQRAENAVVGAPCGVMDQMTSSCGRAGHLLALLCQPAEIHGHVALPAELRVWGIDSGVRHSVAGADYGTVRTAAFMGARILADAAGSTTHAARDGQPTNDPPWGGHLANIAPSVLMGDLFARLPETMRGAEFLARFGGIHDSVTRVDPSRSYPVRAATVHPVHEHHRVQAFAALLGAPSHPETAALLGELMFQSHASYSACGLGSPGTDALVQRVRASGAAAGLFGAKITGGGSGGTVAVLGTPGGEGTMKDIAADYARETGHRPMIFSGSSDGAILSGRTMLDGGRW